MRRLLLGLLTLAGMAPVSAASTYDASAEVLAQIRQNYQAVTGMVAQGRLLQIKRDFGCLNVPDSVRTVWKDPQGVVRKYTVEGGSSDSALTISQYYGPDGRLSFALLQAGAVNGTEAEVRLYYGPAGNLLRLDERQVHGPGYPFGPIWQAVVQFPQVAFDAPAPC